MDLGEPEEVQLLFEQVTEVNRICFFSRTYEYYLSKSHVSR